MMIQKKKQLPKRNDSMERETVKANSKQRLSESQDKSPTKVEINPKIRGVSNQQDKRKDIKQKSLKPT